jgi:NADH-quinone oxidoreductase subunit J
VIAFWVLAPIMVVAALGMVLVRKAVHSALLLAVVMVSLAVLYAAQEAPFLFAIQIIVYTGAILMMFLFVLMLVGVDASDSIVETIPGQRLAATAVGLLFGLLLTLGVAQATISASVGLGEVNAEGNVDALATLLFGRYVLAFEITGVLLITATLGTMVLAHRERLSPKQRQSDFAAQRMRDYAETGKHPGPLPVPGVYARHNAVDTPALLPDGTPSSISVSRSLQSRGLVRTSSTTDVERTTAELDSALDPDAPSAGHVERGSGR